MCRHFRILRTGVAAFCIVLLLGAGLFAYGDDAKPLFVFDYQGSHIETFNNYSVVDGKVSETHRYFVQSGNLVVIDQNLQPTPRDIFIHFEGGKSYIAVLTRSGNIVSLGTEDLLNKLDKFKNRSIAALSNNIGSSGTTLFFTYEDGSTAAYNCVTGKLLSGSPATEKKSISEYVSDYMTDFFARSTQGFADTSGAKAESVVKTLEESGISLESLMDAGLAEDIETTYEGAEKTWDGEVYDFSSYRVTGEESGRTGDKPDLTADAAYQELMSRMTEQLSKEQLVELRDLFASVASGDLSAEEASGRIAFILPDGNSAENNREGAGDAEDSLEKYRQSMEDVKTALQSIEKKQKEKKFIQSVWDDQYLAVYNAAEKRYDIYSQETLMKKPDNLVSEASKMTDVGNAEALNRLLAGEKGSNVQNGIRLFVVIAVAIVAAAAILLVIVAGSAKNKKKAHE